MLLATRQNVSLQHTSSPSREVRKFYGKFFQYSARLIQTRRVVFLGIHFQLVAMRAYNTQMEVDHYAWPNMNFNSGLLTSSEFIGLLKCWLVHPHCIFLMPFIWRAVSLFSEIPQHSYECTRPGGVWWKIELDSLGKYGSIREYSVSEKNGIYIK